MVTIIRQSYTVNKIHAYPSYFGGTILDMTTVMK